MLIVLYLPYLEKYIDKNHLTILHNESILESHFRMQSTSSLEILHLVEHLFLEGHTMNGILLLELVQVVEFSSTGRKVGLVRVDQLGLVDDCDR
jgi:hypothetical protein